ncbi:MAG TPA: hypothetical protein EYN11_05545 [Phycisphaerales bacterium]|nr:hypothetical protein [Phycisphaerales bacterium]
MKYDVAILGAGFSGSISALIADQMGLKTILLERGTHPRFAIGESSTPQADITLASLAEKYNLPFLKPLSRYGSWKESYPELNCGPKRGFTYIQHPNIENELLVAASPDNYNCDCHWYREDFDAFLVEEVKKTGVDYFENTNVTLTSNSNWNLQSENVSCTAEFIIDATGGANPLHIPQDNTSIHTNSRAIYSHFTGVTPWGNIHGKQHHPYRCHDSALHHVFAGGWMYVLHFDNGITSAGFILDCDARPNDTWESLMLEFPNINEQFKNAVATLPIVQSKRMQRCTTKMVGENWAMLPHAAAFLDPLHSAGNALTLNGIERLMPLLQLSKQERIEGLNTYQNKTTQAVKLLDKIIHGCYNCFDDFEHLSQFAMLYFVGADFTERQKRSGTETDFLNSGNVDFRNTVDHFYNQVVEGTLNAADIADAIKPWNMIGLCDPSKQNMYDYT